jgi:proteasome alpha subunit
MTTPFYVSPQQVLADRAEYARKGIARGRSIVALRVAEGILFVAENPMPTLHKVSEIYDRIAFCAVGRYNEFEALRVAGVRRADLTGYSYSREDVTARSLAGVYSQTLGQIFTHELKPMEVELLVAEVGHEPAADRCYRVTFDGQISDEPGAVVMGGASDDLAAKVRDWYPSDPPGRSGDEELPSAEDALRKAVRSMVEQASRRIGVDTLEIAILERDAGRRAFRRIEGGELSDMLGAAEFAPGDEAATEATDEPADEPADDDATGDD